MWRIIDPLGMIAHSSEEREGLEERFLKHVLLDHLGWDYFARQGYRVEWREEDSRGLKIRRER